MHGLLRLEYYEDIDAEFEVIAIKGRDLLQQTYALYLW